MNNDILKSGIYMIKNKINGKIYIGQTHDFKYRWMHHKTDLRSGNHHNNHLQNAWNKYGEENFEFSIIEQCSEGILNDREKYWINHYDSYDNGYNLDLGGNGTRGYKHTDDEINKMRRIQQPNIIFQFDNNFNFIKEWIGGVSHIHKELKYTKESIELRCFHTCNKMSLYKDCYWVFKEEYENENFSWEKYLNNIKIVDIKRKRNGCHYSDNKIIQYSKDGAFIKEWNNMTEILDSCNNYKYQNLHAVLIGRYNTAYGFIWKYKN